MEGVGADGWRGREALADGEQLTGGKLAAGEQSLRNSRS